MLPYKFAMLYFNYYGCASETRRDIKIQIANLKKEGDESINAWVGATPPQ